MKNIVPFAAPVKFAEFGIDWTREPVTDSERSLREAFLTYESSCGPNGLVSLLLLAIVSRRQASIAEDLQAAADHAEILLRMKLHKHQCDALDGVHAYLRGAARYGHEHDSLLSKPGRTTPVLPAGPRHAAEAMLESVGGHRDRWVQPRVTSISAIARSQSYLNGRFRSLACFHPPHAQITVGSRTTPALWRLSDRASLEANTCLSTRYCG